MIEAAGTSGFSDAALAYSAGWRGQSAAGSVAATTTSLAAGAQQDADTGAEDSVAFCNTALQALAWQAATGLRTKRAAVSAIA